ncbi:DUF3094 family protein [Salinisphaera sp. G21_0]|uniref:DUF3094 family protein n=1 Tax=Thalassotalea sp. G20_0 TaxID=2821093 RepID=UPI001AD99AED|nr:MULTISPECIES: DUF3094 family protein [Gammaproteobacteria]MBO9482985.1 DUF3094 family protein [Salinisphaera sp. G21_0]MBO9496651.1 DUF3094 family protein [Thalassotalea sp. G20_0]
MSQNTSASVAEKNHIANSAQQSKRLYPEDQQRVDHYLKEGVNEVERSPFRPLRLMAWLTVVIVVLGVLSRIIGYLVLPA